MSIRVIVESAPKRSFASALDWPGWARSGKTPDEALTALVAYGPRYARVAKQAKASFSPPTSVEDLAVVERLAGGGGTEFGVPGEAASGEDAAVSADDLARLTALLRAAWATFDTAATTAKGVELAKGPRGGGRDLDKIRDHVREAETAYLGQLGSRPPSGGGMDAIREAFLATLTARVRGEELPDPRKTKRPWSPRYAVRRSAWHVLDHAWEIEDRSA